MVNFVNPIPSPQLYGSLEGQKPHSHGGQEKQNFSINWREKSGSELSPKALFTENVTI